jgi:hypothetical protein
VQVVAGVVVPQMELLQQQEVLEALELVAVFVFMKYMECKFY